MSLAYPLCLLHAAFAELRSVLMAVYLLQVIKGYQKFSATPKYMVYN